MKKIVTLVLAFALVLTLAACGIAQQPQTSEAGQKSFTVTVVHADGTIKELSYETDVQMLGDYLEEQGLIASEGADDGMFHTVDGEKADWNETKSYWAFYLGEEYAMSGIYDTVIADGAAYRLVYTCG